jgi:hypothetical protein
MPNIPSEEQLNRSQFLGDASRLDITNSAPGAPLDLSAAPGSYWLFCAKPFRFKQGASGVAMSDNSTKGSPVPGSFYFGPVFVTGASDGFITARTSTASDTGTLEAIPVS